MAIGTILTAVSLIKDLAPGLGRIVEKFLDGKASKEELEHEAAQHNLSAEVQLALAQVMLNSKEATHPSIFVAGWRPAVGWICAIILLFNFVLGPLAGAMGFMIPVLDAATMMPVLLGMLGVGGMRSFEKMKGVHRDNLDRY